MSQARSELPIEQHAHTPCKHRLTLSCRSPSHARAIEPRVDAAIVRILKTRREIKHNLLVAEVIQQLQARFEVKTSFIKERLEALMDDYLERSPDDRSVYLYKM